MSDKVKAVIEAMVWELRSLEKRGVFEQEDVKTILKRREDFEFRMNKNSSTDVDYLEAIEYEMRLVSLQSYSAGGN